jgi:hypothetical protein
MLSFKNLFTFFLEDVRDNNRGWAAAGMGDLYLVKLQRWNKLYVKDTQIRLGHDHLPPKTRC